MAPRPREPEAGAVVLTRAYEAKVRAELKDADRRVGASGIVPWTGTPFAGVLVAKGEPGPAEASGGAALSGADGEALAKALVALELDPADTLAFLTRSTTPADEAAVAERARRYVEAVDPWLVLALDRTAASDVCRAVGVSVPRPGAQVELRGRQLLVCDGFEASLDDAGRKRTVWRQLQGVRPPAPVW